MIEHPPEDTSDLEPTVRLLVDTVKQGVTPEIRAEMIAALKETPETQQPTGASTGRASRLMA